MKTHALALSVFAYYRHTLCKGTAKLVDALTGCRERIIRRQCVT